MQSLGESAKFQGDRGRLLGLVECSRINIKLELIREGHSYFDTRFSRPLNYVLYARQEAQAFNSWGGYLEQP